MALDSLVVERVRRESRIYQLMAGLSDAAYAENICKHPRVTIRPHGKRDKAQSISRTGIQGFHSARIETRDYIVDAISQFLIYDQNLPQSSSGNLFAINPQICDLADEQRAFLRGKKLTASTVRELLGHYHFNIVAGDQRRSVELLLDFHSDSRTLHARGVLRTNFHKAARYPLRKPQYAFLRNKLPFRSFLDGYGIVTRYYMHLFLRDLDLFEPFLIKVPLRMLGLTPPPEAAMDDGKGGPSDRALFIPKPYGGRSSSLDVLMQQNADIENVQGMDNTWANLAPVRNIFMQVNRIPADAPYPATPFETLWSKRTQLNEHILSTKAGSYLKAIGGSVTRHNGDTVELVTQHVVGFYRNHSISTPFGLLLWTEW